MELLSGRTIYEQATEAASHIQTLLPIPIQKPAIAVICGSGLGGLANILAEGAQEIHYADIPYFPRSTGMQPRIEFTLPTAYSLWKK